MEGYRLDSKVCKVPMLLKGVINPEDAERGLAAGADGIIVSNHGARCLDTQPATIEALPRVAEKVAGRVPVLVDGGIRRGTDIVKAIALGATAVQIGRPYVYGLAAAGEAGVAHVLKLLRQELLQAMALLGRPNIALPRSQRALDLNFDETHAFWYHWLRLHGSHPW